MIHGHVIDHEGDKVTVRLWEHTGPVDLGEPVVIGEQRAADPTPPSTPRDLFAAAALVGLVFLRSSLGKEASKPVEMSALAQEAFHYAESMLLARARWGQEK